MAQIKKNIRRHERSAVDCPIKLTWTDSKGDHQYTNGRCVGISRSGMELALSDPVEARAHVSFKIVDLDFHGSGTVRYCIRRALKYRAGIEFIGGLTWTPPDEQATGTPAPAKQ